jgi:hypothetical protein
MARSIANLAVKRDALYGTKTAKTNRSRGGSPKRANQNVTDGSCLGEAFGGLLKLNFAGSFLKKIISPGTPLCGPCIQKKLMKRQNFLPVKRLGTVTSSTRERRERNGAQTIIKAITKVSQPDVRGIMLNGAKKIPHVVRSCPELSGVVRSCPELSGIVRNCPELSGIVRNCPELSGVVRSCPELSGAVRSCPELSGVDNSRQLQSPKWRNWR